MLIVGLGTTSALAEGCQRPAGGTAQIPKTIAFDTNNTDIKPEFKQELDALAARYKGNPDVELCVIGRADRTGDANYNKEIAMKRAEVVADFLRSAGLKDNKYQVVSAGQPYSDDSWIGKLLGNKPDEWDRRVDVIVMDR